MILFRGRERDIFLFYVLATVLGVVVALWSAHYHITAVENGGRPETAINFFIWVLAATVIFLLLIKLLPWLIRHVVTALEAAALFVTTALLFSALVNDVAGLSWGTTAVLARLLFPGKTRNLSAAIIGGVSAGVIGASLSPVVALILYVLLIIYDFLSVFVTGHMVELAKGIEPGVGRGKNVALGGGDLVVPLLFATSWVGLLPVLAASVMGAVTGVWLTFKYLKLFRRPLPALPYIGAVQISITALSLFLSIFLL